jgi:anti-sigma regulatory factor (Ser/Thr protein kinase)
VPPPVGPPLGAGLGGYRSATVPFDEDTTLLLYTDGLVETPGGDIEAELRELVGAVGEAFAAGPGPGAAGLETVADHVLRTLLPDAEGHNDDVTLLLTRLPEAPLATVSTELSARASAVAEARGFLGEALVAWGCAHRADDACLLLSELLTNSVRHARGPIGLRLHRTADELTVEISDHSPERPHPRLATDEEESGRGLIIVDTLAESWGVRPNGTGKTTWFTLRL